MEACLASGGVAGGGEGDAALGEDGVAVGEGREVLVDDGFVEVNPRASRRVAVLGYRAASG